jgi:hypothetical protein
MDFMGNYISGSTESKECQALFQTLAEIPGRDQEIWSEAIYHVFAPIEATAFTPDEWNFRKLQISDYARNGVLV